MGARHQDTKTRSFNKSVNAQVLGFVLLSVFVS